MAHMGSRAEFSLKINHSNINFQGLNSCLKRPMHKCLRPIATGRAALRTLCCNTKNSRKLKSAFRAPEVVNAPKDQSLRHGSPFEDLRLEGLKGGRVRVRQHVNPFRQDLQLPTGPLNWSDIFEDPKLPLWVDAGCGSGRFLLLLAKKHGQRFNYLGADIRDPLIARANNWVEHLSLTQSVHFVLSNVTVSLESLLDGYPGPVDTISIQFPDPQFKARHRKRHIVQESFVKACASILPPGGFVYFQSDVEDCSIYVREMFSLHGNKQFQPLCAPCTRDDRIEDLDWSNIPWLATNPIGVPTERELHAAEKGFQISRMMLVRK